MAGKSVEAGAKASGAWGGSRPGAGRKRKPGAPPPHDAPAEAVPPLDLTTLDMLQFLQAVALGQVKVSQLQVRAAIAAVQYTHTKRGDGGKKEQENAKARETASAGRFTPGRAPQLVAADGKRLT